MIQAKAVRQLIGNKIIAIGELGKQIKQQLLQHNQQLAQLQQRNVAIVQEMAALLLVAAPEVNDLPKVQALLAELQQVLKQLQTEADQLEQQIAADAAQQTALEQQLTDLETQKQQIWQTEQPFVESAAKLAAARAEYQQMVARYKPLVEEFQAKLAEYDDGWYNYLRQRKFGQADYKAWPVWRHLDSWLAEKVNFAQNFRNQTILQQAITEAKKRAQKQRDLVKQLLEQHKQQEQQLQQQIDALQQQIADKNAQQAAIYQRLEQNQQGQSSQFRELAKQLAQVMQQLSLDNIKALALKTSTELDDQLCNQLTEVTEQMAVQQQAIQALEENLALLKQRQQAVLALLKQFDQNQLADSNYYYQTTTGKFDNLLEAVTNRQTSIDAAIKAINLVRRSKFF